MPANIAFSNGQYNAMYVDRPAWHDLGTVVAGARSAEEALALAGNTWSVEAAPVAARIDGEWVVDTDHVANYRSDTKDILGIVGTDYQRIQNITPMRFLNEVVGTGEAGFVAHAALGRGERLFAVLDLARLKDIRIPSDPSRHDAFLVAQWWHNGDGAFTVTPSMVRVDCQNMANANLAYAKSTGRLVRVLHVGDNAAALDEARRTLGFAEQAVDAFVRLMSAFADTTVPEGWIDGFTERLIPIPAEMERPAIRIASREAIKGLYESSTTMVGVPHDTAYRAFNAVTEYADHYRSIRTSDPVLVPARRFTTIVDGPSADLKADAARLLREEFEIR